MSDSETWTNATGDNDLSNPANWSGGSVPGAGTTAVFASSATVAGVTGVPGVSPFAPSAVSVASGANVTFTNGAVLFSSDGDTNTYTFGTLDIAAGATVAFDESDLIAATINVSGRLDFSDAADIGNPVPGSSLVEPGAATWSADKGFGTIALAAVVDYANFGIPSHEDQTWSFISGTQDVAFGHMSIMTSEGSPGTAFDNVYDTIGDNNTPSGVFLTSDPYTALFDPTTVSDPVPCFIAGGTKAVEDLLPGDRVLLADGSTETVKWIGKQRLDYGTAIWIDANAFMLGVPYHPVLLSPDHAVYCYGILIPAHKLVNDRSIVLTMVRNLEYIHVELHRHAIMTCFGLPVESFLDTGNRIQFAHEMGVRPMVDVPSDLSGLERAKAAYKQFGCAPWYLDGPIVDRACQLLAARACALAA